MSPRPAVPLAAKLLLTPWEAAALTGMGRSHAYALIRSGRWLAIREGTRYLVPRAWLEQWIARQIALEEAR